MKLYVPAAFAGLAVFSILICSPTPGFAQLTVTGFNRANAALSNNGAWSVSVPAQGWKFSGAVGANVFASTINTGNDNLGGYQELSFNYLIGGSSRSASIRMYPSRPIVLFSVTYNSSSANVSPFPSLSSYPKLSHVSFNGEFAQPDFINTAFNSPLVYFDGTANAFILSAASDFMTASSSLSSDGSMSTGISSRIDVLPAGFTHQTVLAFGSGINATFLRWGQALTDLSGKKRPANDADVLLKSISYWTDNGANYYYNAGGPSYTGTLEAMKSEFTAKGIGLGSLQLDSWWYPKGPDNIWSEHGGIWSYTAAPDIFPTGLTGFHTDIGVPLLAHSRWIDEQSPYRTQYTMSGDVSIDPKFWEDTGNYLKAAGVAVYEQDWLAEKANTAFNLADPGAFLGNMAASMASRGINIQYCTPTPSHYLQSTLYSNVTTIRDSNDRFGADRWTYFFYSARLTSALGAWPFTDVFMSSETNNLIAATLSAGPIGVGDAVGALVPQNLLKSVRTDGTIVKPDVAATPLDSVFINDAQGTDVPMVVSAYSDFGGGLRATYIFAYPRGTNTAITVDPSAYGISGQSFLYDYLNGTGKFLDLHETYTLNLTAGPGYFILTPVGKTGIAFLGDRGHFATAGKARIPALSDNGRVDFTVSFAPGEAPRTLFGFSPGPVIATALAGTANAATWDPATQIFTLKVGQAAATGTAHVRLIQSFDPNNPGTTSSGCGFQCGAGNPGPGPAHNR